MLAFGVQDRVQSQGPYTHPQVISINNYKNSLLLSEMWGKTTVKTLKISTKIFNLDYKYHKVLNLP
jgi:hypothetical protein